MVARTWVLSYFTAPLHILSFRKVRLLPTILPTLAHIFGIFRSIFIFARFFGWLCYAVYEVSDFSIGDSNSSDENPTIPQNHICFSA